MVTSRAILDVEPDEQSVRDTQKEVEEALSEVEELEPELDTRDLQRQIDDIEGPSFDADGTGMGSVGSRRRGGFGGSSGGPGIGSALGAGAIGGGTVLNVALKGAVGLGILSATEKVASASPAFGQQEQIFGAALQNFAAPVGRFIAEEISGPNQSLLEASVEFRKAAQEAGGLDRLLGGGADAPGFLDVPGMIEQIQGGSSSQAFMSGSRLGAIGGGVIGGAVGGPLGLAVGGGAGAALGGVGGVIANAVSKLNIEDLMDTIEGFEVDVDNLFDDVRSEWPGWPDIGGNWPGWPDITGAWPGWPDLSFPGWPELPEFSWPSPSDLLGGFSWPSVDDLLGGFSWPSTSSLLEGFEWPNIGTPDIPDWSNLTPDLPDWSDLDPINMGNGNGNGNGNGHDDTTTGDDTTTDPTDSGPDTIPQFPSEDGGSSGASDELRRAFRGRGDPDPRIMQHGGIVTGPRQGVVGEAGDEAVLPLDTFLNDLQAAIRSAMQNGNGQGGSSDVVDEIQDLRREHRRTRSAVEQLADSIDALATGKSGLVSR